MTEWGDEIVHLYSLDGDYTVRGIKTKDDKDFLWSAHLRGTDHIGSYTQSIEFDQEGSMKHYSTKEQAMTVCSNHKRGRVS